VKSKDLLWIVERGLADSKVEVVSTDLRIIAAFSAALTVAQLLSAPPVIAPQPK
jgi:hypothetical protein